MFRRFMIVCWVLFAIPAVISLVSWPVYFMYQEDDDNLYVVVDLVGDDSEEQQARIGKNNLLLPIESFDEHLELKGKIESWGIAARAGAEIAAMILIWNIICHTVTWVIVGRKSRT